MKPLPKEKLTELRKQAGHLRPLSILGKNGITTQFMQDLSDILKAQELVKVKVLKQSPIDPKPASETLSLKLGCYLIQQVGRTLTLYKPKPPPPPKANTAELNERIRRGRKKGGRQPGRPPAKKSRRFRR